MSEVVRVDIISDTHFGKDGLSIDLLENRDRAFDGCLAFRIGVWVLGAVELGQVLHRRYSLLLRWVAG